MFGIEGEEMAMAASGEVLIVTYSVLAPLFPMSGGGFCWHK